MGCARRSQAHRALVVVIHVIDVEVRSDITRLLAALKLRLVCLDDIMLERTAALRVDRMRNIRMELEARVPAVAMLLAHEPILVESIAAAVAETRCGEPARFDGGGGEIL